MQAADEGVVHVVAQVGRQDDDAVVLLHPLQQVADLDVGVAVVGVLDLGALAEDGVGLVEEQDGVAVGRLVEDAVEVLLGLADVLADHRRQVDLVQLEAQLGGDDLGGHRLAGAGRAGEEGGRRPRPRPAAVEAPRLQHGAAVAHRREISRNWLSWSAGRTMSSQA